MVQSISPRSQWYQAKAGRQLRSLPILLFALPYPTSLTLSLEITSKTSVAPKCPSEALFLENPVKTDSLEPQNERDILSLIYYINMVHDGQSPYLLEEPYGMV